MDEGHDGGNGHDDEEEDKPFYVCAKLLSGKSFVVDLSPSDARPECRGVMTTVATAKERIGVVEGLLPDMVRLIFAGKRLQDDRPLAHYNVRCGAQLTCCTWWCACAPSCSSHAHRCLTLPATSSPPTGTSSIPPPALPNVRLRFSLFYLFMIIKI
jgi:hypothetical protein